MTAPRAAQIEAPPAPPVAPDPGAPGVLGRAPAPQRRWVGLHPAALLLHLGLALFFTWPLALNLGGNGLTPGSMVEDRDQNLWNLWWVKTALLDLHTNPFVSNFIYWPAGVSLRFHTLNIFNGLISIPFQAFLPLPVIYNGIVLLSFALTGWGAYLLLHEVLARRPSAPAAPAALDAAAAVGSAVFAYSAYHLATQRGLLQLISVEWVPFYILFLFRAVHDAAPAAGTRRRFGMAGRILVAAGFLLLVALVDWYYVMYTLLFTACYGLYLLGRAVFGQGPRSLAHRITWMPLARLVAVVILFFVLAGPLLLPMLAELQQATYMRPPAGEAVQNSADLLAFFLPPRFQQIWGGLSAVRLSWPYGGNGYEVYLGYVALALALWGLLGRRRPPATDAATLPSRAFWGAGAALFGVLALGPVLQVNGVRQTWLQPMPYSLAERIPGVSISRSPDRFAMPLMLCLSVLAGYGVLRLADPLGQGAGPRLLAGGLLALSAVELWPLPYPQLPAPVPAYYQTLGQDPTDYAILELPREDSYWQGAFRMYFQTAHHKRIFYGYISREYNHPFLFDTPGFMELENPDGLGDLFADGPAEWLSALAQYQTRYIVLYKAGWRPQPPPDDTARYRAALAQVIGADAVARPVHSDADLDVYRVPAPPRPVAFLSLDTGWGSREATPAERHRWMGNSATLRLDNPAAGHLVLAFQAWALGAPRRLMVRRDGGAATTLTVGGVAREYRVDLGSLPPGASTLALSSPEPLLSPKDLGMNEDTRLLGIAFSQVRLEPAP